MWLPFSLGNAFFESIANALAKKGAQQTDSLSTAWAIRFFSLFIIAPFVIYKGFFFPDSLTFWLAISVWTILITINSILFVEAIKDSPLSLTLPIVAFTPVFLLLTSPIIVGEYPSLLGISGVLLVFAGSYVLNISNKKKGIFEPILAIFREKGPRIMFLVAFIFSITSNLDKIAIKSSNPLVYSLISNALIALILTLLLFMKRVNISGILKKGKALPLIGIIGGVSFLLQMVAVSLTQVPYAISVKRTSAIFGSLWGYIFFKEKKITERLIGTAIMVAGVILIALS